MAVATETSSAVIQELIEQLDVLIEGSVNVLEDYENEINYEDTMEDLVQSAIQAKIVVNRAKRLVKAT